MRHAKRLVALGGIALMAVALSGCVVRPIGWGHRHGHQHYGERAHSEGVRDGSWEGSYRRGR